MPVVISFTVETDGVLPDGSSLSAAILEVDEATGLGTGLLRHQLRPSDAFRRCAGPMSHWTERIHMVRANASRMSHAELDEATDLDDGDPTEFGREHAELR